MSEQDLPSQDSGEEDITDTNITTTSRLYKLPGKTQPSDLGGFHNQFHYTTNGIGD